MSILFSPLFLCENALAFYIRGEIIDEKAILSPDPDEDQDRWASRFDTMDVRGVKIIATIDNRTTLEIKPDGDGKFWLESSLPIISLALQDDRGRFHIVKEGLWAKDTYVEFEITAQDD